MPQVNSPSQTYVHQCELEILPQSWPSCAPHPTPQNKGENNQKHLPSLQQSETVQELPLQGDQVLTLVSGYHVLFKKEHRERRNQNIDHRAGTSCRQRASSGLGFHVSACVLGVVLSFVVHPSLAAMVAPHNGLASAFFDRLIMLGWNSV